MRSGDPILRNKRAHNGHASPGVSASASQDRERLAPSRLARMRLITYLSITTVLYGLRWVFGQHASEESHENIRVAFRNDQRRPKLDDIVKGPVRPGQDTAFAKPVYHVCRLRG